MSTLAATLESTINQLRALQNSLGGLGSTANIAELSSSAENFAAALQQQLSALASTTSGTASTSTSGGTTGTATATTTGTASTTSANSNAGSGTPVWRKAGEDGSKYLLAADADLLANRDKRPNVAEFIQLTGADSETAIGALYGAVAGVTDYRNWDAILQSGDPLNATRQANAALFNSDLPYQPREAFYPNANELIAQSGNYGWIKESNGYSRLWIMDSKGMAVSPQTLDAANILRTSRDYGLDISALKDLASQLDAKGIQYKPGDYLPGSTAGVDLAALGSGGLGAAFDWRVDPLAAKKGTGAAERLLQNIKLAAEAGIAAIGSGSASTGATLGTGSTGTTTTTGTTTSANAGVSLADLIAAGKG